MNELSPRALKASPSSTGGTAWPPSWNTMPHGISVGRYVDPEFQRLEYDKLWSRVWQVAIRADEIPETNDYTVYRIGDRSVLLVESIRTPSKRITTCVRTEVRRWPTDAVRSTRDVSSVRSMVGAGIPRAGTNSCSNVRNFAVASCVTAMLR